ncbi:shikimate kinase [Gilvimarinus agarilyticus]|uniref:shikimate kinase n=1 Tax=unclassified Gilvimarinus TaxID=2642066 RepID=UPI001C08B578|nr:MULTISPECIES: shikimate kinase [unclassified Gilvimarinus]MBU2886623.1 shikimate kinase [Gilvimarinus agarilyticus]MDO6571291.1 shikimate kinase [Gilvimarinus sp. 2_MG-2023]MDO6746334.1 shikimate kinase [Gilvimarinus sp. 1_MG-2023]
MIRAHVFLVGPMGVGKSTIGRMLASDLGLPFLDTDRVIEERTGADIPWIFDMEGEDGFRQRETNVLADICQMTASVVATGGGIVTREKNLELMRNAGTTCYLQASVEQLVERTARDKKRPLLQVDNPREKIEQILAEREPSYRSVSQIVVNTDRYGPKAAVQEILEALSRLGVTP